MPGLPVTPGEVLAGKYRVERVLGEGGQGIVVAAEHLALGERIAIKMLRPEVAEDEETVARFLREARASVRIKGEHVTRVLDVGSLPSGLPYMVMEYLEGADLSAVVETRGWLPTAVAIDYVVQTCEALAEAHALGIVHRDIKPSNLFLTTRLDGSPCIKVLDFGISKAIAPPNGQAPEVDLTQTQTVLGSPQYMAPEQMRSSRRVDARTDIWAIGATLHELLTGGPPFDATSIPELFAMILQDPAPRLRERRPDIPETLEAVVARCLEKEPGKRFDDVVALARALAPMGTSVSAAIVERIGRVGSNATRSSVRSLAIDAGSAPAVDLSRTEKTGPPVKRERSTLLIAGAIALMTTIGVAGIVFGVRRMRAPAPTADATMIASAPSHTTEAEPSSGPVPSLGAEPAPAAAAEPTASAGGPRDDTPEPPPAPASAGPIATTTAGAAGRRADLTRAKPPPGPATSHTPAAPSAEPTPAPTVPPRAPGVASSRYD